MGVRCLPNDSSRRSETKTEVTHLGGTYRANGDMTTRALCDENNIFNFLEITRCIQIVDSVGIFESDFAKETKRKGRDRDSQNI